MWGIPGRRATAAIAHAALATATAALLSACAALPFASASPEQAERMPGPASVWLTSDPATPARPVRVAMTAPDPGILFAHTFPAGEPLRGILATSEGRYTLSAFGGACRLPLDLRPDDEAQVVLTIAADGACTLSIAWQGTTATAGQPRHGDGTLITNHDAGGTPHTEPRGTGG